MCPAPPDDDGGSGGGGGSSGSALPPWVHYAIAGALFFYQTMDALDGKQARNTRNSSPLGQLFDHGCDGATTTIVLYHLTLAIGLTGTPAYVMFVAALLVFFCAQWEEGVTGTLRTSVGQFGVTEAQLMMMAMHLAAGALPCSVWSLPVPLPYITGKGFLPVNHLVGYGIAAAGIVITSQFVLRVTFEVAETTAAQRGNGAGGREGKVSPATGGTPTRAGRTSSTGSDRDLGDIIAEYGERISGKADALAAGFLPLVFAFRPFMWSLGLAAAILGCRFGLFPSSDSSLSVTHPGVLLMLYALCQTHVTVKTIVFSMAHQKMAPMQWTAALLPAVVLIDAGVTALGVPPLAPPGALPPQVIVLYAALAAGVLSFASFVHSSIYQIATRLGIKTLVINPPRVPVATAPVPPAAVASVGGGSAAAAAAATAPTAASMASPASDSHGALPSRDVAAGGASRLARISAASADTVEATAGQGRGLVTPAIYDATPTPMSASGTPVAAGGGGTVRARPGGGSRAAGRV